MIMYALLNPQYHMKEIKIDREVIDFIKMNGKEYKGLDLMLRPSDTPDRDEVTERH